MGETIAPETAAKIEEYMNLGRVRKAFNDFNGAAAFFQKAVDLGDTAALIALGDAIRVSDDEDGAKKSVEYYRQAYEAGEKEALYSLACAYREGIGVPKDEAKGAEYFRQMAAYWQQKADAGDTDAMNSLATLYLNGRGVAEDDATGLGWLKKSAEAGNREAMNRLGHMYDFGNNVEEDIKAAIHWHQKAAEAGSLPSCLEMARYNLRGFMGEIDVEKGIYWFKHAIELYEKDPLAAGSDARSAALALQTLAHMYMLGLQVEKDEAKGLEYYAKAAEMGDVPSMFALANYYHFADDEDKHDIEKAMKYYQMAADMGNTEAMICLGMVYEQGEGVPGDIEKAIKFYEQAADEGDSRAMLMLGHLYRYGKRVPQNYQLAISWYEKAVAAGDVEAVNTLGVMFADGIGVKKDDALAMAYYKRAANCGHATAMANLGWLHFSRQAYAKAFYWAKQGIAAEADNGEALYLLGTIYEHGLGARRDLKKAEKYYSKAVAVGFEDAAADLRRLKGKKHR